MESLTPEVAPFRAAEAAAATEAGPRDPARAEPRAVAQTADRVSDALAGFS
jgi:hypothetical protein